MVATPTAADLKARYPEFAAVGDPTLVMFISDALPFVDDGWVLGDQPKAILALAAHLLFMEGYPARSTGGLNLSAVGREVVMRKVGDVTTQYAQISSTSDNGILSSLNNSPYGKRFAQLLKLNAPAIALV